MVLTTEQFQAECALLHQPLNDEINRQFHELGRSQEFPRTYGRFISRSPRPVSTIEPHDFLQAVSSPGQSFVISDQGRGAEDRIWTHGDPYTARYDSLWPFPVNASQCQKVPDSKRLRLLKADVASWPYAALQVYKRDLAALFEAIVSGRLNVVTVVSDHAGAFALLRVDADSYGEWRQACQACAETLKGLGMEQHEFRLNTLLPIPNDRTGHHRIVYLA